MKVTKVETLTLDVPIERPIQAGLVTPTKSISPVIVKLYTDGGLDAFGMTFAFNNAFQKSLRACVDDLAGLIIGQDIVRWQEGWQKLWNATSHMGHTGYGIYSIAAFDQAMWVLRAKAAGVPLAHILGGVRDKVPVYASYSLWLNWTIDDLQKSAAELVSKGFKVIKMKMGNKTPEVEMERLHAVREAVGKDIQLMVDVNWSWTEYEAIRMGHRLEEEGVYWLEDPLTSNDPDQLGRVSAALGIPVAIGETFCTKYAFRELIEKKSGDIFIIDVNRVGGITEWMRVAAMAQAWNIPVCNHMFHDFSMHMVAASPNGLIVEYMNWWDKIYDRTYTIRDGMIEVPQTPGIGLELDPAALKKFAV